mgnify:CR=1 FL=1
MLTHVRVQNFQSLKELDIACAPVTFVIGPGNVGKSALIRAIRAVVENATGDDFIRQGTKGCKVELTFKDGVLLWEKESGKGGTYTLNGQPFDRTRGEVPEPVREFLNIRPIEVDSTSSILPQIHDQFDGPFIVGETGSRIARIFGKLTKLDVIVTAQMLARKELRAAQADDKKAAEEQQRLRHQIEALPEISPETRSRIDEEREQLLEANASVARVEQVRAILPRLLRARQVAASTVDLTQVREDLVLAHSVVATLDGYVKVHKQLIEALAQADRLAIENAQAEAALALARQRYDLVCSEAHVCPECPWR